MKRALVTGANGFVGKHLCETLTMHGWHVRGTVRRMDVSDVLPPSVERVVTGDIQSFRGWREVLQGVDAIVHLVGRTHVMKESSYDPLKSYREVNVSVTRHLLQSCQGSTVKRFVFVSSIKAVGEGALAAYRESDECRPENPYGVSKREAEELLLALAPVVGIAPVILRPPLIYGPGVLGNFRRLLRLIDCGIPLPLGLVRNRRSLLYVGNLATAIVSCLEHPRSAGEVFHLADQHPVSTRELTTEMSRALGRHLRLLPAPTAALRCFGHLLGRHDEVSRLVDSLTVSTEKIQRVTGWQPQVSLQEGLAVTVRHFRAA